MKRLAALIIFLLAVHPAACQEQGGAGGPHLTVSSAKGNLESGRAGSIFIELQNDGGSLIFDQAPFALQEWLRAEGARALDIRAELESRDERIEIVSGEQPAGSLATGENRSLEFTARVDEGVEPGVYPAEVVLSYRRLSEVDSVGDSYPDIYFQYQDLSETIPLEVEVVRGPRLSLECRGDLSPGGEAELVMVVSNEGDQPAAGVAISPSCRPPLACGAERIELGDLKSGESASARLKLSAESGAIPGFYAFVCRVAYRDGESERIESTAALVRVKSSSWIGRAWLPFLALLAAAGGVYLGVLKYRNKSKKRR